MSHVEAAAEGLHEPSGLGGMVRRLRMQKGLTLKQLAGKTELSISFLSQAERNQLPLSVSALKRIADALDIPAGMLMFGGDGDRHAPVKRPPVGIVRRTRRKRVAFPDSHIRYELLTPDLRGRSSVLWLSAAPGADSGPSFSHDGEDGVFILSGRLMIEVGGVWHELDEGDSIFFNSALPHRWRNRAEETAEAIWISTPPSF
jgi:transcriptional regulator with XRE-family HTH domain